MNQLLGSIKQISISAITRFQQMSRDEIKLPVRMLNPPSLNATFGLAKIQEEYWMGCKKRAKLLQEQGKSSILGLPKFNSPIKAKTRIPIKRISQAQMEERKEKGLCYNCDDK